MGKKLISVLIPTYNRGDLINQTIKSVLNQTYENIEVIVSDDGSKDNTRNIMKKIKDKRVKYYWNKHSGIPSVTRNNGLKHCKGEYIAFLDSDDLWLPEKLQHQIAEFEKDKSIGLVCSNGINFNEDGDFGILNKTPLKDKEFEFRSLLSYNPIICSSVILKKEILNEVGNFNENPELKAGEDYHMWLKVATKYKITYIESPLVKYRTHAGAIRKSELEGLNLQKNIYQSLLEEHFLDDKSFRFIVKKKEKEFEYNKLLEFVSNKNNINPRKMELVFARITNNQKTYFPDKSKLIFRWISNLIFPKLSDKIFMKIYFMTN
jgi:glycosyltransferase involved in cell wall biosynthesis